MADTPAPKQYTLRRQRFTHPAGTVCYAARYHDYGCANDDTRSTGQDHTSVTLNPSGGYPFFTVPVDDLEEVK